MNTQELMNAINKGSIEDVKRLIDKGADVNAKYKYEETPLMLAVSKKNIEIAKLLIDKGADINAENDYGGTPLTIAIGANNIEFVVLLIDKGADINAKDRYENTPLMTASSNNHIEIVNLLLEKGADINAKGKDGNTALMIASSNNHIEIVNLLLEKGADKNAKDRYGDTALSMAQYNGYTEIIKLLKLLKPLKPKLKKGPWKGMTQADITQLDTIFEKDAIEYSICPICLQFIRRSDGCDYMSHDCTKSGKPYHERLYELYQDNEGIIHWCTICNRITKGHTHYKLEDANTTNPSVVNIKIFNTLQYFEPDCSISSGGGGPNEKLVRFHRFREYALKLQEDVGKKDSQEAFEELVEEVWNAPLRKKNKVLKKIMNNKAWNIPSSAFPLPIVNANNNSPNIPYKGSLPNKINSGHNNITMNNNVPIIRFVHKQPDGIEKTHGISEENLENFIKSKIGEFGDEVAGYCFMYPGDCKARLYPQEIKGYVPEDLYNTYKKKFNNKFKNFSGGGSENLIQEATDAQCVIPKRGGNRNTRKKTKKNKKIKKTKSKRL